MSGVAIPWIIKMIIAGVWDIIDFAFGWAPGVGSLIDGIGIAVAIFLWGPKGLIAIWELIAIGPGNLIDMWIPTTTIIGLLDIGSSGGIGG